MKERVSGALESYLEQIAELQLEYGAVRTSDLADRMGCKRSSVTNALQRLSEKGLIHYQSYRPVTLTEEGQKTILTLNRYHEILADFLENVLAFPEEFAQQEACRLEHRVSLCTIERMNSYLAFIRKNTDATRAEFKEFLKKNNGLK
ncbi:MAG: metal-dependent transcriptional regulator [Erysipelotrichia bacterium]|nr:metal-dependent transcriptional regulator [Erysipelotrichia bacterium]